MLRPCPTTTVLRLRARIAGGTARGSPFERIVTSGYYRRRGVVLDLIAAKPTTPLVALPSAGVAGGATVDGGRVVVSTIFLVKLALAIRLLDREDGI
jgi:hypothetical protein